MDVPVPLCLASDDLRPIGKLEAFVQNLTSEVVSTSTTSFRPLPTLKTTFTGDTASLDSLDDVSSDRWANDEQVVQIVRCFIIEIYFT